MRVAYSQLRNVDMLIKMGIYVLEMFMLELCFVVMVIKNTKNSIKNYQNRFGTSFLRRGLGKDKNVEENFVELILTSYHEIKRIKLFQSKRIEEMEI